MTAARFPLTLCAGSTVRHGFTATVEAAAAAGFQGVTVWKRTVRRAAQRESLDLAAMRRLLADHALVVSEIEGTAGWLPGWSPADPDELGFEEGLEIAAALGAPRLVVHAGDHRGERGPIVERFATACDRAAEHGVDLALEFLPWTVVPTLAAALDIVREAGRPNGRFVLDTWHHARSGGADVPDDVPIGLLGCVQICDGPARPVHDDLLQETMHHRLLPGEGDFRVAATLARLAALGAACSVGVEVYNASLGALGPGELATTVAASARAVLPEAGYA